MLRPAGGAVPPPPPGLRIEVVRDEETLRAFEVAIVRGFTMPELEGQGSGAAFSADILTDDRQRLWVGWDGDRRVRPAADFVAAGIHDVTLGATGTEPR